MKKHIGFLTILCLATAAQAQGTVNFNNNLPFATVADRLVRVLDGRPLVGTDYVAQLYYGAQGTPSRSLAPVASPPARFRLPTTSVPGTWIGGTRTLDGITAGQTASLQVRYWNLSLFATYEAAVTGHGACGESAVFDYTVPPAGAPPAAFFMENFRTFFPVPEPSSLALAALGALGLLAFRRWS